MKFLFAILTATALLTAPAFAQDKEQEKICRNGSAAYGDRVEACNALIKLIQSDEQKARNYTRLGNAHDDNEFYDLAIENYDIALELRPEYEWAMGRKAGSLNSLSRHDEAIELMTRLVEIEPDDKWNHYYLGQSYQLARRWDEAIPHFEAAIEIDPEYFWPYYRLGRIYWFTDEDRKAAIAYDTASRIRPFNRTSHDRAFMSFKSLGMDDLAAYHARFIHTNDPNVLDARDWLRGYMGEPPPPEMAPMEHVPPTDEKDFRYLRVLAPVDTREDIQKEIEELINFFGGSSYPKPVSSIVYDSRLMGVRGDIYDQPVKIRHRFENEKQQLRPTEGLYRGLFPVEFRPLGPDTPVIEAVYGDVAPSAIWPLEAGNVAEGTGEYWLRCPEQINIKAFTMGCKDGGEDVQVGSITWIAEVEGTEQIHVPMGKFDTYVLRYRQSGDITLLGKTNQFPLDVRFWMSPELNTWVQRHIVRDERFLMNQLMEIREPKD